VVIEGLRGTGQPVWVCCALGFSRSAASVVAWLGLHGAAGTLATAHAAVRRARPQIVLRAGWLALLDQLTSGKVRHE
jgi:protein-tyrosine phosphatase